MDNTVENAAWAGFATVLGLLTATHWLAQLGMSVVTLIVTLVVAHFVRRELLRRWPLNIEKEKE
jgi:hypothetical protein